MIVSYPVTHPSLCYPSRLVIMKIKTSTRNPSRIPVGNQDVRRSEPSKKIYATWKLTWQMEKKHHEWVAVFLIEHWGFQIFFKLVMLVFRQRVIIQSWNPWDFRWLPGSTNCRICRVFVNKKIENPIVFMKKTRGYGDLLPLCVGRSVATRSLAIAAGGGWTNRSVLLVWTFA